MFKSLFLYLWCVTPVLFKLCDDTHSAGKRNMLFWCNRILNNPLFIQSPYCFFVKHGTAHNENWQTLRSHFDGLNILTEKCIWRYRKLPRNFLCACSIVYVMMETKDVQMQGKAELLLVFCCSYSCTGPAQLFNLCAAPRARCWSRQWRLLLSGVREVWDRGELSRKGILGTLGGPLANTQKIVPEMTVNPASQANTTHRQSLHVFQCESGCRGCVYKIKKKRKHQNAKNQQPT